LADNTLLVIFPSVKSGASLMYSDSCSWLVDETKLIPCP